MQVSDLIRTLWATPFHVSPDLRLNPYTHNATAALMMVQITKKPDDQ